MPSRVIRSNFRQTIIRKDKALRAELTSAMSDVGNDLKANYLHVVSDWKHQPRFVVGYSIRPTLIMVSVRPEGRNAKIWRYVDEGTKAHRIYPRVRGGKLTFQTGYSAKTAPVAKFGQGSGQASGQWVTKDYVEHPGVKAREFTETIEKEYVPEFRRKIENAFRRALRR